MLSLSFPNFNTEQPIHNLLLRQRRPETLAMGCAAMGGRKDCLLGGATHERGPFATTAMGWQRRWEWGEEQHAPAIGSPASRMPPNRVSGLAALFPLTNLKVMELP